MRSIRWGTVVLLSVVTIAIYTAGLAVAQTSPRLEELQVDLWPEYDRPDMLVIYRGTVPADLPLPATLTLRIPARVGEPHAVAYDDGSGSLFQANYSTRSSEDWLVITFETPAQRFQLEFYDTLTRAGEQRTYTFVWPGDYAVDELRISLLPPLGASGIQTEPAVLVPLEQESGASRYMGILGKVAERQETQVRVSYQGGVAGAGEAARLSTEGGRSSTLFIAGGVIAVLTLVISGAVWYTRRPERQPEAISPAQARRSRGRRRSSGRGTAQEKLSPSGHCTQCGHLLRVDDRFCGHCGAQVKRKTKAQG